jgi:hypothetical protein
MERRTKLKAAERLALVSSAIILAAGMSACAASVAETVNCDETPNGAASATATPGKKADIDFGYARKNDEGDLEWQSKITLVQEDDSFGVSSDGYGPRVVYKDIPGPNYDMNMFVRNDNRAWVGAHSASSFNTSNKLDPNNQVIVTLHCGAPPAS